jgi:hypothetical protein
VKFDEPAEAVDAPHDVIENFQIHPPPCCGLNAKRTPRAPA